MYLPHLRKATAVKRTARTAARALTVLAASAALGLFAGAAPAAADEDGTTYVFVVGSQVWQTAQDDIFNAGRENTVGSHNGGAGSASALAGFRSMTVTDWTKSF
ncbi:hypothetical protein [Streptomyces sp. WAC06614]|uniref:hypothetical protein n=1 Tax=Streptomyces sp. WAC06614 TaxID=2487416 RepID=UPI000F796C5A|nr:hypothetical protein [Streptomyces sp. WAC06614]RSS78720.1 hypothetical protein EF918_19875 [Streptomyces sp. WAC06614]